MKHVDEFTWNTLDLLFYYYNLFILLWLLAIFPLKNRHVIIGDTFVRVCFCVLLPSLQVCLVFDLESSACRGELVFMERYQEVLVELCRVEAKIESQSMSSSSSSSEGLGAAAPQVTGRSRLGSSGRSTLQAIGSAAAAGSDNLFFGSQSTSLMWFQSAVWEWMWFVTVNISGIAKWSAINNQIGLILFMKLLAHRHTQTHGRLFKAKGRE